MVYNVDKRIQEDQLQHLALFTESRYTAIVRHKTAFYSFYLPVALGLAFIYLAPQVPENLGEMKLGYIYPSLYLLIFLY